jgi:hypothetical protein
MVKKFLDRAVENTAHTRRNLFSLGTDMTPSPLLSLFLEFPVLLLAPTLVCWTLGAVVGLAEIPLRLARGGASLMGSEREPISREPEHLGRAAAAMLKRLDKLWAKIEAKVAEKRGVGSVPDIIPQSKSSGVPSHPTDAGRPEPKKYGGERQL